MLLLGSVGRRVKEKLYSEENHSSPITSIGSRDNQYIHLLNHGPNIMLRLYMHMCPLYFLNNSLNPHLQMRKLKYPEVSELSKKADIQLIEVELRIKPRSE